MGTIDQEQDSKDMKTDKQMQKLLSQKFIPDDFINYVDQIKMKEELERLKNIDYQYGQKQIDELKNEIKGLQLTIDGLKA